MHWEGNFIDLIRPLLINSINFASIKIFYILLILSLFLCKSWAKIILRFFFGRWSFFKSCHFLLPVYTLNRLRYRNFWWIRIFPELEAPALVVLQIIWVPYTFTVFLWYVKGGSIIRVFYISAWTFSIHNFLLLWRRLDLILAWIQI